MLEVVVDLHCGGGQRSSAESAFCVGKIADYKRRSAVRLRGKLHPSVGRRLTKPAVLYFPCLRHGKCAASPHPAALVRIAVTACISVETPLSAKLTSPLSWEKNILRVDI